VQGLGTREVLARASVSVCGARFCKVPFKFLAATCSDPAAATRLS
jgi:hypothetical protein